MNDEIIEDLKQFIGATISQQTTEITDRLDKVDDRLDKVDARLDKVETKLDDLSTAVAESLDVTNEITDAQVKDHDIRITKLEHNTA